VKDIGTRWLVIEMRNTKSAALRLAIEDSRKKASGAYNGQLLPFSRELHIGHNDGKQNEETTKQVH
jgi:hypothetical protein